MLVKSEGSEEIHFSNVTKIPWRFVDFVSIFVVSTSLSWVSLSDLINLTGRRLAMNLLKAWVNESVSNALITSM